MLPPAVLDEGEPIVVAGETVGLSFVPDNPVVLPSVRTGSPEDRFLDATTVALAWSLAAGLLVALGLGWWLSGRTARPLRALTEAARGVADGDLGRTVEAQTDDEVGQLAAAFNAMSARLAESTELRRQMTADVAHDLRTPLTAVMATLEAVGDGALPATPERLATAHGEAARLGRLVEDLHTLALADAHELPIHLEPVDVIRVLFQAARAIEAEATTAEVTVHVEADDVLAAHADPDRLAQVVGNLVGNALRHTPPGGRITLGARAHGDDVLITVADTGSGIPVDVLPHVFERSVRADISRREVRARGLGPEHRPCAGERDGRPRRGRERRGRRHDGGGSRAARVLEDACRSGGYASVATASAAGAPSPVIVGAAGSVKVNRGASAGRPLDPDLAAEPRDDPADRAQAKPRALCETLARAGVSGSNTRAASAVGTPGPSSSSQKRTWPGGATRS